MCDCFSALGIMLKQERRQYTALTLDHGDERNIVLTTACRFLVSGFLLCERRTRGCKILSTSLASKSATALTCDFGCISHKQPHVKVAASCFTCPFHLFISEDILFLCNTFKRSWFSRMSSWVDQVRSSHNLQLAATAVASGLLVGSAILGLQKAKQQYRVSDLKSSIPDLDKDENVVRVCFTLMWNF